MGKSTYEEYRQKRLEENKKRLEDLNLLHLSQSLRNLSPKPSPVKTPKPRSAGKQLVAVRRSARVANNPAPVYVEVKVRRLDMSRRTCRISKRRDLSNRVYASDEARADALEKAEQLVLKLDPNNPTLIRSMLPSHVTGGFWLGLPVQFCRKNLPLSDQMITLVDEDGNEYPTVYLMRKKGLSGGWKGFAEDHELVDGDAVVFQVINHGILKVYIIRVNGFEDGQR
ncbi:hypothetical protein Nepgr_005884 [Nepenthes gracilis]|uniref:TF-B3 domain-containing protein n=1 Tax=Nepenthes gracilis TaxID=150966 RepID=A0AAD3S402_NEPGR|nr:hypothetical protein Nepgr_005884 [Nepenthes gracilis]